MEPTNILSNLNSLSDNALMQQVKSGNTEQLGLLYERYKKLLFNFFYQMNFDKKLSEDLVQNVFIRVLKYKHTYTDQNKFVSWIFQIARNENYDYFNKNVKNKETVNISKLANRSSEHEGIQKELEKKEAIELLNKAIQQLPYKKREVIILSKLKQLKYSEIGIIIGCNEVTARAKAHRALKELKTMYLAMQNIKS